MRTYSHLLVMAVLARPIKRRGFSVHTPAFLTGSMLPDIPFAMLTAIYGLRYQWQQDISWHRTHVLIHDIHFFKDPVWVVGHNFFHASLILVLIGLVGYWLHRRGWAWGNLIFWFAVGAGLHTAVDTLTHYDDGPLLLFPFDWAYRFRSPVSYWDPNHYGELASRIEMGLNGVLILYLLIVWWRGRSKQRNPTLT